MLKNTELLCGGAAFGNGAFHHFNSYGAYFRRGITKRRIKAMENISYAAKVICIASLCAALLNIFSPDGTMKKSFKYALGVFVLCAVIIPVKDINIDLPDILQNVSYGKLSEDYTFETDGIAKDEFERRINYMIEERLKSRGISGPNIQTFTDIDSDNCIYIKKTEIYIDKEYTDKISELKADIENYFGIKADIFVTR